MLSQKDNSKMAIQKLAVADDDLGVAFHALSLIPPFAAVPCTIACVVFYRHEHLTICTVVYSTVQYRYGYEYTTPSSHRLGHST
jgi:hypothetical protein